MTSAAPTLSPQQLLALLTAAIEDAPRLAYGEALTDGELKWLGRVDALLEASGALIALAEFRVAKGNLGTYGHDRSKLMVPLHAAYSRIELQAPAAARGRYIPPGETWNGYAAIVSILERDCGDMLLVDPYLDSKIYTEFAPHSNASSGLRCLTAKRDQNHPAILASATKWANDQISNTRPFELRYAAASALHDRLFVIDRSEVWLISQSIKDIAKRSPASLTRAEPELAELKAKHYEDLWSSSETPR